MGDDNQLRLGRIEYGIEVGIWVVGLGLMSYLAAGVFGFVSKAPGFYVSFAMGTVALAGLFGLRLQGVKLRGEGVTALHVVWTVLIAAGTVASLVGLGYMRVNIDQLVLMAPFFKELDITMGFLIISGIIILTWYHWGWILAVICGGSIAYFFFGQHIPIPLLRHSGYDTAFILNYVTLHTSQGFFQFISVAADELYFLIIFGVTLLGVGMLNMVIELGKAAGGRVRGGAALPAILGSAAIGSVMGQAVSNVALTGRLTIPMMKQAGYSPAMAGAIEATASTSGQILPPVLGLAGFLIASILGVPYPEVALAALIPAVLYLVGSTIAIGVYAYREGISQLRVYVDWTLIRRSAPTFLVALVAVVWLLLGFRSAGYAGIIGIALALGMSLFQGKYRPRYPALRDALREGIYLSTILSLLIIAIGPLGQVVVTTDLSGRLASYLAVILPDIKILLLIGTMILCIILGMGLPTPIAYIIAALAMVPFLQEIGVTGLQAHFFVFYFAVFSTLSPPIAVSILTASKIADARFLVTCIHALKIASTTFIIPFAFVYNPVLLTFPNVDASVLWPIATVLATQICVSIAAYGFFVVRLGAGMRLAWTIPSAAGYATVTAGGAMFWDIVLFGGLFLLPLVSLFLSRRLTMESR
jgi:TRAP transporter 4TM/12TM fusion protein